MSVLCDGLLERAGFDGHALMVKQLSWTSRALCSSPLLSRRMYAFMNNWGPSFAGEACLSTNSLAVAGVDDPTPMFGGRRELARGGVVSPGSARFLALVEEGEVPCSLLRFCVQT